MFDCHTCTICTPLWRASLPEVPPSTVAVSLLELSNALLDAFSSHHWWGSRMVVQPAAAKNSRTSHRSQRWTPLWWRLLQQPPVGHGLASLSWQPALYKYGQMIKCGAKIKVPCAMVCSETPVLISDVWSTSGDLWCIARYNQGDSDTWNPWFARKPASTSCSLQQAPHQSGAQLSWNSAIGTTQHKQ